jgi:uncharacterized protein YjbI with pentapeptide repeats
MDENDIDATIQSVLQAETSNFSTLVRMAGLNRYMDFRYADLNGIDFSDSDLIDFDFTGSLLLGCQFTNARIEGALFTDSKINKGALTSARDYQLYLKQNDAGEQIKIHLRKPYVSRLRYELA